MDATERSEQYAAHNPYLPRSTCDCNDCIAFRVTRHAAVGRRMRLTKALLHALVEYDPLTKAVAGLSHDEAAVLHDQILDIVERHDEELHRSNLERFAQLVGGGMDPRVAAERVRVG